jgi:pre-mRNA-splicing factor 18
MDFLAAEIARKRKEIESSASDTSSTNKKFIRQKDIAAERERKYREDQERLKAEREAKAAAKLEETRKREQAAREREAKLKKERDEKLALEKSAAAIKELTDDEVKLRLRELEEPIKLFAETPDDRKTRLENVEAKIAAERRRQARLEAAKREDNPDFEPLENLRPDSEELQLNLSDVKRNPNKVYEQLYRYFKVTCQEWSKYMDEQDPEYKNSPEGIEAIKIQKQCLEDFRPLFRALKRKVV